MPFSTNVTALRYSQETAWNTALTTGWKELRYTGESLSGQMGSTESAEIVATRESQGAIRTSVGGGGAINLEWHYGTFDDFLGGCLGGTLGTGNWVSDVLKVGTAIPSFSLEKAFSATLLQFFTGQYVTGMEFNASIGSVMTGSFSFIGPAPTMTATKQSAAAPTAINTNAIWNTVDHISAITEGGSALTGVQSISLSIDNGVRRQDMLGSLVPIGLAPSTFRLSGSLVCYLSTAALINKFLNFTDTSLAFTLGTGANKKYAFAIGAVNYTSGEVVAGGGDQDVLVQLNFTAKVTANTTLQITRTP